MHYPSKAKKKMANLKKKNWVKFGKQNKLRQKKKLANHQKKLAKNLAAKNQQKKKSWQNRKKKWAKNWLANFANFPTSIIY